MPARPRPTEDFAPDLAVAVVESSVAPLLLLDGELTVIAASASFCRAFDLDAGATADRPVFDLGAGEWNVPQFRSLLGATAAGDAEIDAYEMDLVRDGQTTRTLVLHAEKLAYGGDQVRLMLAVSDVTDVRAGDKLKDDMLREKAILLREVRHRVANSLQIIASVLLQNARKTQSEETRSHLHDAHQRVMSVAALEQQLSSSTLDDVQLRTYFGRLCDSIRASMIRDPKQLSLEVMVDDSAVNSDTSVSLGLIVTELVINALKHAFPDRRPGVIVVAYHSDGAQWTLSVRDDGVGMPQHRADAQPGLGTSIIEALANQLKAEIRITDAGPGTAVSIVHARAVKRDLKVDAARAV
ncbi:MAG: sensor histidine kinase [Phenylobacterium sp.]